MNRQKDDETKPANQKTCLAYPGRIILETSMDGFCRIGFDSRLMEVNLSLCNISGYSKKELLKMKILDLEAKMTAEQISQRIDKTMTQGYDRFETKLRRKDGKIIDVEVSTQYCENDAERFLFAFLRDITNFKLSKKKLQKSERLYKTLCNNIPGMVYRGRFDWSTKVISQSNAICGYSPEEFNTKKISWLDIIHPDDKEKMLQESSALEKKPKSIIQEYRIIDKNGSVRWVEDHKTSTFTKKSVFDGVDGIVFDITERKLTEDAFKESEERFESIVSSVPGLVYRCKADKNWTMIYFSKETEVITGYPVSDFLDNKIRAYASVIHPDDRAMVEKVVFDAIEKKKPYRLEYRIIHKNGEIKWILENGKGVFDTKGNILYLDGVNVDITERKRAEDEIRKFGTIADKANYGVAISDLDGNLLYVNEHFAVVHGYTPEELIGRNLNIFHNEDQIKVVLETLHKLKEVGNLNAIEIWHTHKNGTVFPMLMNVLIIKDENNQHLYMAATAIDITEKKQLEAEQEKYKEQVLNAQRHAYIGSMGAIVAHQVNQPLTKINILLDRAIEQLKEASCSPNALKDVKEGLAEAKEATSIIHKFRQYSKDSALEGIGRVNVSAAAEKIVSILSERTKQAKMRISIKDLGDLPEVETNETALEQIFLIIIQNAIEAADEKKLHKLDITGKFVDNNIELRFTDDCCGIAPENLDKIFEPFFSTKTEDKGMGLGLDIVQQILINCGGQIRVESDLDKGTTFYVTLPISNALKS